MTDRTNNEIQIMKKDELLQQKYHFTKILSVTARSFLFQILALLDLIKLLKYDIVQYLDIRTFHA